MVGEWTSVLRRKVSLSTALSRIVPEGWQGRGPRGCGWHDRKIEKLCLVETVDLVDEVTPRGNGHRVWWEVEKPAVVGALCGR